MGTQFFWFFDLSVAAILIISLFQGIRKGFVSMLVSCVAMIVAFAVALPVSGTVSASIYNNVVKDAVSEEINNQINNVVGDTVITRLKKIDMSKAKINGKELSSLSTQPDKLGKINLDLTKLDVSDTGIEDIDLSAFGVDKNSVDYSALNLGKVEITAEESEKYGIDKMILASVLSENVTKGEAFSSITESVKKISESLPSFMSGTVDSITSGNKEIIKDVVVCIIDTNTENFAESLTDNMVKPILLVPMRALIFLIIFVIIVLLLNIIAKLTKKINSIPLVGGINKVLGVAAGAVQGVIAIFLICIFVQVIIALTGNEIIFLNTMTIDETFIFKKIYYLDFLNFMA